MNNSNKMIVRQGKLRDLPWLLKQLKEFSDFFNSKISLFDPETADEIVKGFIEKGLVLVAEKDSKQIGFIAGAITPHLYNPKIIVLAELFWWVPPEHRNSRAGYLLLKKFVEWGRKNVNWIMFTLEEKSPVNEKALVKQGFKLKEKNFILETGVLSWQAAAQE